MLHSIGVEYVIIGHSERRMHFGETNEVIAKKVSLALEYEIKPIFCCGEPLEIREAGTQNEYVKKQLEESLFHLQPSQLRDFVIAYEPIWAIGTGKTASDEQAQEMHAFIRKSFAEKYGQHIANYISILYGGSIKSSNAKAIFSQHDVDGGLVGGASLIAADFGVIIDSLKKDAEV
jgi:triosephosphate isomerase